MVITVRLSVSISEEAPEQAPFVYKGDIITHIKKASEIGYEAVELHIRHPENIDADAVRHACDTYKVEVSSIGTGLGYGMDRLSLSDSNPAVRRQAVERLKGHISLASKWNCLVIIGLMKGQIKDCGSREEYEKNVMEALQECVDYAESRQVLIVLEAINRYESDVLNTLQETTAFIREFDTDYLKLHIDTFHMNMEENSIPASMLEVRDYIGHVHAADNNRLYPGNGFFDFKTFLDTLKVIDYQGDIALECTGLPRPDEAALKARSYLYSIL